MKQGIRHKIEAFVSSPKEYPFLAGATVGVYMLLFYYSRNYDLANSIEQLCFFIGYFILLPALACIVGHRILTRFKRHDLTRRVLFVIMLSFFGAFILQHLELPFSWKKLTACWVFVLALISFRFSNYKAAIVLIALMSVFPAISLATVVIGRASAPADWNRQPDDIANCTFAQKPNVYFLQVDGYANAQTLKGHLYRYDNSSFDRFLSVNGFTHYDTFRSNYNSTLKSNASCFNMLHHYSKESSLTADARDHILGENPVLAAFRHNGYESFFISERPYLLMNRPKVAFDYVNFTNSELPYLHDGWSLYKSVTADLKKQIRKPGRTPKFFFVEKFDPGHIATTKKYSKGKEGERNAYLQRLEAANDWLRDIVSFIIRNDRDALIIVGADHGGYVGFDYTYQMYDKVTNKQLLHSAFGAKMAIRWNRADHGVYDAGLKTSVNLFRCVFSCLSRDTTYLSNLQPDTSYNSFDQNDETKIYKALE